MTQLTLELANRVIAEAFKKASGLSLAPLSVVVVDAGGHVIAFQRQDGASFGRLQIALGKAAAALSLGVSSRKVADMAIERPWFVGSFAAGAPHPVIAAAGGLIIINDAGAAIGAVGITGDTSDNDELCASTAILAAGLKARA
ncbi:GlcG/HbpS family heme-binding protein [Sphingobium subterraneum]|uniref:Uncharacterized protein GlcG (DUF336 family) n=1 Tax=Sphingobium subterraneum TaxID=627688 RepID=A0A841IXL2_9SPHN|nr:heme-binding protein [Sphingobium subterraneum]MBB6123403.1 uncharacterized protein GlcG (DUF336 family) [Sphingobium subterraneum]